MKRICYHGTMNDNDSRVDRQIGARIRSERERAGVSRATLAAQARLSEAELEAVEFGDRRPRPDVLLDLANSLSLPLADLMRPD